MKDETLTAMRALHYSSILQIRLGHPADTRRPLKVHVFCLDAADAA